MKAITNIVGVLASALILSCTLFGTAAAAAPEIRWQQHLTCTFSATSCNAQYVVPTGQRVTIQYIADYCVSFSGSLDEVEINPTFNGASGWVVLGTQTQVSGVVATTGSYNVNLYADQSTIIYIGVVRVQGAATGDQCSFTLSGYIDANVTQ